MVLTRRELVKRISRAGLVIALGPNVACNPPPDQEAGDKIGSAEVEGRVLNDKQSQLNKTRVARIVKPGSLEEVEVAITEARRESKTVSIAGGRHAMGGQQFATDAVHLDTTHLNRVLSFDREKGQIEVQAGIQWPDLLDYLIREQTGAADQWTIRQKQTGVDHVTLGGTLAANAHGRGLRFPPIVDDVESLVLVDSRGTALHCSRRDNAELFSLAIGGYGLFGVITQVVLRLVPRTKVRRDVNILNIRDLLPRVEQRVQQGYLYGDCQYSIDFDSAEAPHVGVFSCYQPVDAATPISPDRQALSSEDWGQLIYLAHVEKRRAFELYIEHYKSTSGQIYWSDLHQMSNEFDGYHAILDDQLNAIDKGTEMITEVYIPEDALNPFLVDAKKLIREHGIDLIYGTIRFIEKDDVSFLAWAREPSICVLCNMHVDHTEAGVKKAAMHTRLLIDLVVRYGGRYFLTYHRWATRSQIDACYPQFAAFLRLKRKYDPEQRFQSEWYRFYRSMFADSI